MAAPQVEKRTTRRFTLRLPLTIKLPQKGEITAHTRDISSRGVSFYLDSPLQVGAALNFTLTLPPEVTLTQAIQVRCNGRVVRIEESPENSRVAVAAVIDRYEFMADRP